MAGETTYEKSAEDLVDMYRDLTRANVRRRLPRLIVRIVIAGAAVAGLGFMLDETGGGGSTFYAAALAVMLIVPSCWLVAYLGLPRVAHRIFTQQRTDDPVWTWRWSREGLASTTATGEHRYGWGELYRWENGRRTVLFFLNELHVLYIPKRRLTAAQLDDLVASVTDAAVGRY